MNPSPAEVAVAVSPPHTLLTPFDVAALVIVLAAGLGYFNHRVLRLPQTVGLTLMGALASLIVVAASVVIPGAGVASDIVAGIARIDFHATLMDGMLSFLLFAGAMHVDWSDMKRGRWPIAVLSTVGVVISTMLVGGGFYALSHALGQQVPLAWCLVFGALISPTDPVAVMGVLKRARVDPTLEATVAGESLFNDGVGIVIFTILLATALGGEELSLAHAGHLFVVEAGGGAILGLAVGWLGYRMMRSIDDYALEVLISLAMVMGGYALASALHISGPVAMAVAGLIVGNEGVATAMSDTTRDYLMKFWAIIDEILNAALFVLIGLEVVTVPWDLNLALLGAGSIVLVLAVRAISVGGPLLAMRPVLDLGPMALPTLIWGGLRGGISIALALGLPDGPPRQAALAATYVVVLFSVIVQGGSIAKVIDRLSKKTATPA